MAASSGGVGVPSQSRCLPCLYLFAVLVNLASLELIEEDILVPYCFQHGARHGHRVIRECQPIKFGNVTSEEQPAYLAENLSLPLLNTRHFITQAGEYWNKRQVQGHISIINNPIETLSVVEPAGPGGCSNNSRSTVQHTAEANHCILAANAGLFNTHTGACYGNLVTDGHIANDNGGIQNAHFGITQDNQLYFGYLTDEELTSGKFKQLVGGVIWLVRAGENYIQESLKAECSDTQETGSLQRFVDVVSARTAIGADAEGKVALVQVEGKTDQAGMSLPELADMLISWGIVNAINLDGGGSSTLVSNDTLINYPSDICKSGNITYGCARKVTSVICVHEPTCQLNNCSGHGDCILGYCHCHDYWAGPACDRLHCGTSNCSGHGKCHSGGCSCDIGWAPPSCSSTCTAGWWGANCSQLCECNLSNSDGCSAISGDCHCNPGYSGRFCDKRCPIGTYGYNCRKHCYCGEFCGCHHVTGDCNLTALLDVPEYIDSLKKCDDCSLGNTLTPPAKLSAGRCIADRLIEQNHLVPDQSDQLRSWLICIVVLAIIASVSIILNISLLCVYLGPFRGARKKSPDGRHKLIQLPTNSMFLSSTDSSPDESDAEEFKLRYYKKTRR